MMSRFGGKQALVVTLALALVSACGGREEHVEVPPPSQEEPGDEQPAGDDDPSMMEEPDPAGEDPVEDPMDDPMDEPTEDPMDDPAEDPIDDPMDEPMEPIIDPTGQPNEGWIGGACASTADCDFEDALCLSEADGFSGGQCSQACDKFCPDRDGANSVTFCVASADGGGQCMPRCDFDLFPGSGCREGYDCKIKSRHMDPSTQVATCVPPTDTDVVDVSMCVDELTQRGVPWTSWAYSPQHPDGDPSLTCVVEDPIRAGEVINGVTYKYYNQSSGRPMYMSCELADALWRLGDVLQEYDITEVLHIGTFNCRKIGGTSRLSQHGLGNAIDIYGFVDKNGTRYILEDHWEHDTTSPMDEKARVLYEIGQRMHTDKIFHNVLTPNYNAAHDNHFHVDLAPGADFIGARAYTEPYFGSDEAKWQERCHH